MCSGNDPEQWYCFTLTYNDFPGGGRLVHGCVIVGANFVKRGIKCCAIRNITDTVSYKRGCCIIQGLYPMWLVGIVVHPYDFGSGFDVCSSTWNNS